MQEPVLVCVGLHTMQILVIHFGLEDSQNFTQTITSFRSQSVMLHARSAEN